MTSQSPHRLPRGNSSWTGERIGRLSLRLDALYCTVLGLAVAAAAPLIAGPVSLPAPVVLGIGLAVIVWAGIVVLLLNRLPLRAALRLVMIANLAAAAAVAAVSALGATLLVLAAVLTIAIDIALFAGSQAWALRRLRSAA